jgi:hypothetical protein
MKSTKEEPMIPTYEQLRQPDWWTRGKTWGERYEYLQEWARLLCGTRKRYDWLRSRNRIFDDADWILR